MAKRQGDAGQPRAPRAERGVAVQVERECKFCAKPEDIITFQGSRVGTGRLFRHGGSTAFSLSSPHLDDALALQPLLLGAVVVAQV
jgi:hypothetical protein